MDIQKEIVFIEQTQDSDGVWRTHRVMVKGEYGGLDEYDVDWSKRDATYYYDKSGGGPDNGLIYLHRLIEAHGRIWLAPGYACNDGGLSDETPIDPLQFGYEILHQFPGDPFAEGLEQDARYCSICEDCVPVENPCAHVWWCQTDGWYRGPGAEEPHGPCDDPDCVACHGAIPEPLAN